MNPKVLINIPITFHQKYLNQVEEGKQTWVKSCPYPVIYSVPNPLLNKEYDLKDNYLQCKCTDDPNYNFSLKRFYFIKWAITSGQQFDYLYLTDTDTFVHPYRLQEALTDYYSNQPNIDFIGEKYPRGGHPIEENGNPIKFFVHPEERYRVYDYEIEKIEALKKVWGHSTPRTFAAGGVGYILSKRSAQKIVNDFDGLLNIIHSLDDFGNMDDLVIAQFLYSKNISLYNDSRFTQFNYGDTDDILDPVMINIENSKTMIAQHDRQGEFNNIIKKMNIK